MRYFLIVLLCLGFSSSLFAEVGDVTMMKKENVPDPCLLKDPDSAVLCTAMNRFYLSKEEIDELHSVYIMERLDDACHFKNPKTIPNLKARHINTQAKEDAYEYIANNFRIPMRLPNCKEVLF
ncbi:MAG: hypothetical protein LBR11_09515 [Deltaproteobacteria bacterium]|jgi:hypothetical protein|nr:hypothetical protein [Deltaproteobacteria bacterium]